MEHGKVEIEAEILLRIGRELGKRASRIRRYIEEAGLVIERIVEREPYAPEVEYQSRRAYIFARNPGSL